MAGFSARSHMSSKKTDTVQINDQVPLMVIANVLRGTAWWHATALWLMGV
jgi:hypothetical protein